MRSQNHFERATEWEKGGTYGTDGALISGEGKDVDLHRHVRGVAVTGDHGDPRREGCARGQLHFGMKCPFFLTRSRVIVRLFFGEVHESTLEMCEVELWEMWNGEVRPC